MQAFKNLAIIFGGTWDFRLICQTIYEFVWLAFKLYLLYLFVILALNPYVEYTKEVPLAQQLKQLTTPSK